MANGFSGRPQMPRSLKMNADRCNDQTRDPPGFCYVQRCRNRGQQPHGHEF